MRHQHILRSRISRGNSSSEEESTQDLFSDQLYCPPRAIYRSFLLRTWATGEYRPWGLSARKGV
ncbi:unnamed protein product [Tuber aestivum]|uniref:Uncharacterized protein n=1 Tax=Tuber aestivum TaxID=59557 RepID=A0A292PL84_9PEZI|nr:unnamed protein product [Tuber aestivum]